MAGQDAAVARGTLGPGAHVVEDPAPVLAFALQHEGVEDQRSRLQVERVVAHHVGVFAVVLQRLFVARLAVNHVEAAGVEGVAGPVQRGGRAQQRATASSDGRTNQPQRGVVVARHRVFAGVEAGVALHALGKTRRRRIAQAHHVEHAERFGQVLPVVHRRELAPVHALTREFHLLGAQRAELFEMAVPGPANQRAQLLRAAQRVQVRPVVGVLDRVVGAVVGAPTLEALEVTAFVEVALEEGLHRIALHTQQFALQQGPLRRAHRGVNVEHGAGRRAVCPPRQQRPERKRASRGQPVSAQHHVHRIGLPTGAVEGSRAPP